MLEHQEGVVQSNDNCFMEDEQDDVELCKAQVVYYLNRRGRKESPHMIEVFHSARHGLLLGDVKKKLQDLRGKGMPNLFSWSYKRSYRNKYIWQDLCDEEVIHPGYGGEYILKGSEVVDDTKDKSLKPSRSNQPIEHWNFHPEALKNKYRGAELWLRSPAAFDTSHTPEPKSLTGRQRLSSFSQAETQLATGCQNNYHQEVSSQDDCFNGHKQVMDASTEKDQLPGWENKLFNSRKVSNPTDCDDLKAYKIKPLVTTTDYGCDAATQTQQNETPVCRSESPAISGRKHAEITAKQINPSKQEKLFYQASTCGSPSPIGASGRSFQSSKAQTKAASFMRQFTSNLKFKQAASPWHPLHALSCADVHTKLQNRTMPSVKPKSSTSFDESILRRSQSEIERLTEEFNLAFPSLEADVMTAISRDTSKPTSRTPSGNLILKKLLESSSRVSLPSVRDKNTRSSLPTKDASCSDESIVDEVQGNGKPASKIRVLGSPLLECKLKVKENFWPNNRAHWAHLS